MNYLAAEKPPTPLARQNLAALAIGIAAIAMLAGGWKVALLLAAVVAALALLVYVVCSVFAGDCDRVLIGWVLLFPLGYYFLSYPREHPVIQFDRTATFVLAGCMLAAPTARTWLVPKDLKRVAIAWALFLAATLISFLWTPNVIALGRLIVDNFLLPALIGWYVVRQFRLRRHAKWLHAAICVISLYSAALGVVEVALHRELLVIKDTASEHLAYDPTDPTGIIFLRPNGPFTTNNSFALIGLISFFLLAFLWTVIRDESGQARRGLHVLGISAALLQALLPLFRSVVLTIVLVVFIDLFWTSGRRRMLRIAALGLLCILVAIGARVAAGVFQDRASSTNVYGRMAQNAQTWKMFIDHPLLGIGLGEDFSHVAESKPRYQSSSYKGVDPVNTPHNNVGWVAVETGVMGTLPYLMSQLLLFVAFWHLRKRGERGAVAWRYFVFIFLSYWITGMAETAGAYGDLNIWFVFALCLLYRYGAGETRSIVEQTLSSVC